jgi:hypothetical protein
VNIWKILIARILWFYYTPAPQRGRRMCCFTSVRLSFRPSVQDIFRHIFLSNCWWQKSDIWTQTSYRYTILWMNCELMLTYDTPALLQTGSRNLTGQKTLPTIWGTYMKLVTHTHLTYICICPFLVTFFSDIWSQASYRYPISWEAFFDPSNSYFLFAEERGYHK